MTVVGAATPAAFATTIGGGSGGITVITATGQKATNSDDDTNNQANIFAPKVTEQKSYQNSGTQGSALF